jgi:plasmid stabilization system protein ParE
MIYRVILAPLAAQDAEEYAESILSQSSSSGPAAKGLNGLETEVKSLAEMPRRFKVIPEQSSIHIELRQFIYGSHRVIFHVDDESHSVQVMRIYHGWRINLNLE